MKPLDIPAVVLDRVKYPHNLAAAIRACSCFGVKTLLWSGHRFEFVDGERLPREERMKGYSDVHVDVSERPFDKLLRRDDSRFMVPVCVELTPSSTPLTDYVHPTYAVYVFGPEDGSVRSAWRGLCHEFVHIPAKHCLNLAAALNVVLADRVMKRQRDGLEHFHGWTPGEHEDRGAMEIASVAGWDGK
jgi:tRNA(Leu) C34 or U34 (ribose-2'-O)-methylase TrmL